jgi:MerR family transcriptional regulator, redox-sensitive transcriptional activator SoxR
MMEQMTIGELANRMGVRTSAIRFYERKGLLPAPRRVNGRRIYDADTVQKIRIIQVAQMAGFTVEEIHTLLNEYPEDTPPSARWKHLATRKLEEVIALQNRIDAMKTLLEHTLECQCPSINECASRMGADDNPEIQVLAGRPIHSVDYRLPE